MNTLRYTLSTMPGALLRAGLIVLALAAILAAATPTHATPTATIIYVTPGGAGGGTSWADGKDLAAALSGAASGSELWVKTGTYKPTSGTDRTATFALKNGVAVYGGFAGTETSRDQRNPQTNVTTLSGDIGTPNDNSDNSYHVVTGSGTLNTAVLDGFTVSGGNANDGNSCPGTCGGGMFNDGGSPTLTGVTFSGNSAQDGGGGMYNDNNSSPTLTNVTFSGNSAGGAGGMYNNNSSSPTLTGVTFSGNSADGAGGMLNALGSNPTLTNVTFSGNSATGQYGSGGGMVNFSSSPTLTGVTFSGNSAQNGGGMLNAGMDSNSGSNPTLTNVTFSGNSAQDGGGMSNFISSPTLTNVTFSGNSAVSRGGGMYNGGIDSNSGSNPTLTNVTFSGNAATGQSGYGGGMANELSNPTLTGVTFSGNSAPHGYGGGMSNRYFSSPTLTNSAFNGNSAGTGGGMFSEAASPTLTNSVFSGNSAQYGGGMTNDLSSLKLTNVTFSGNSASNDGGGIWNNCTATQTSVVLTNTVFSGNSAKHGGGMFNTGELANPTLVNATFSGNSATQGGGMYNTIGAVPIVTNSIFWGDNGGEIYNDLSSTPPASATVTYSLVQGGYTGTGNINVDPLFVAPITASAPTTTGNLRFQYASPAINAGDPTTTFSPPADKDLDGNPRIAGARVDMGAYESPCPAQGSIIYVNGSASGGNTGADWANAYTTLTAALANVPTTPANACAEIWVAQGTYKPAGLNGDRNATFQLKSNVAVYGGFTSGQSSLADRDATPATNNTVLSGDLNGDDGANFANNGDNSYHVVTGSGTLDTAILDGFTVSGGNANDGDSCPGACGGGMLNDNNSSPTLTNVTFSGNSAGGGGGMLNNHSSSPRLTNVTFSGNSASYGGGMYNWNSSSPMLTNVTFSSNSASNVGGGMFNNQSSPKLMNVTFSSNSASNVGGGMCNVTFSSPTLTNVTFSGNSASQWGGGMSNTQSSPTLTNVTFSGNSASQWGGGMYNRYSNSPTLTNVTFSGNSAPYGGGMFNYTSSATIRNSILWGDTGGEIYNDNTAGNSTPAISFSIVQGSGGSVSWNSSFGTDGGHNLDADPLFVTTVPSPAPSTGGNLRLRSSSPAINAGNNSFIPNGVTTDLDGNPRILAVGTTVDMGAYEVQDTVKPTIGASAKTADNNAYTAGTWANQTVTVHFNCSDTGGSGLKTCPNDVVLSAEGVTPSVSGQATDYAGNVSDTASFGPLKIDKSAPTTTISNPKPSNPTNSASATFTFSASDTGGSGIASVQCKLDNNPFAACTSSTGQSYSGLTDGSHTFTVKATDNAGNTESPGASYTWTVDTVAPTTTISNPKPSNPTNSTSATFTFSASDGGGSGVASVQCKVDNNPFAACASSTSQSYSNMTDGSHTFTVKATDNAGNTETPGASYTWVVDTTPPAAPVVTNPVNGSSTNNTKPTVSGTAEANSTVTVYIDGAPSGTSPVDSSGNWSFTATSALPQGAHTAKAKATDAAGNTSVDSNSNTFTVDTVAPTTTISNPKPSNPTNSTTATFTFSASDTGGSGVASVQCKLDNNPFAACASSTSQGYSGLTDGSHTFTVKATDNAGNTESPGASYTWVVDTIAPTTTISNPKPSNPTNSTSATFTFGASDGSGSGVASVQCKVDNNPFAACTSSTSQSYSNMTDGSHTFTVKATDNAGNTETPGASYTWVVDATPPTISITTPANGATYVLNQVVTVSYSCSDPGGSGVQTCTSTPANGSPIDTSTIGARSFTVNATDNAGNPNSVTVNYFVGYTVTYVSPTVGPPSVNNLYPTGLGPWTTTAKWKLMNGSQPITTGTVAAARYASMTCGGTVPPYSDSLSMAGGFSSTNPRYDLYQAAWLFNWQLPGRNACYVLYVKMGTGQVLSFLYNTH